MFIVTAGLSYRSAENNNFQALLTYLAQNPAHYKYPSRKSLKNQQKKQLKRKKKKYKNNQRMRKIVLSQLMDGHLLNKKILKSLCLGMRRVYGSQQYFICFDDNQNRDFINILKKVSSRRNKLSGDSLEDIIFLYENADIENDDDDDFNTEN